MIIVCETPAYSAFHWAKEERNSIEIGFFYK